jgi:hypothetical protein
MEGQTIVSVFDIYSNQQIKFYITEYVNYFEIFIFTLLFLLSSAYDSNDNNCSYNSTDVALL